MGRLSLYIIHVHTCKYLHLMTDFLIRQSQIRRGGICSTHPPQWQYTTPTPSLQQRGLTPQTLRETIDSINQTAARDFENNFNANYALLPVAPALGSLISIIFMVASIGSTKSGAGSFIAGIILFHLFIFCAIAACVVSHKHKVSAIEGARGAMQQFVEVTLNEQWQNSHGVRWTMVAEQTLVVSKGRRRKHGGRGPDRISTITWFNIQVTALQDASAYPISQPVPQQQQVPGVLFASQHQPQSHQQNDLVFVSVPQQQQQQPLPMY